jgi:hypothetical protein
MEVGIVEVGFHTDPLKEIEADRKKEQQGE